MTFTPVVRWRNFTLPTFKAILNIYPDLSQKVPRQAANELLENAFPGYKKTVYQYACQLGLEDRSVDYLRVQEYLFTFSDENLERYLRFWTQTYYAPNPYVRGEGETPVMIYLEAARRVLASEGLQIDFGAFFAEIGGGGSYDILLNVLSLFGAPLKSKKIGSVDYLFVELQDRDALRRLADKIATGFPLPANPLSRDTFFERYAHTNFSRFYSLPTTVINETREEYETPSQQVATQIDKDYQRILVGAPGTGKSYRLYQESEGGDGQSANFDRRNIERVTFHSNYTYQQFVGTYKPRPSVGRMNNRLEEQLDPAPSSTITYEYVPGPFLRLLARALLDYRTNGSNSSNYLLIVEEINRAHAAGVFGDVFQLLDRDATGQSEYGISCSEEMQTYLEENGLADMDKLYLPPNFYIWATMNNADQGVYPMDTAFKRRWSFEYVDINENEAEIADVEVEIRGYGVCKWNTFRKHLNNRLIELNVKEDKLIGPFFIAKSDLHDAVGENGKESRFQRAFKFKLLMYLADDVFKHSKREMFGENRTCSQIIDTYNKGVDPIFTGMDHLAVEAVLPVIDSNAVPVEA